MSIRNVLTILRDVWDRFERPVGDDIFVSYSRADGATYANGLAGRLTERKFATKIDQWGTVPGEQVPPDILRAVRRSAMLVIVGTKGAVQSEGIEREIKAF